MNIKNGEDYRPFILATYNSFCNLSLGKALFIWSIFGIFSNLIFYLLILKDWKSLIFLVYYNDSNIVYVYYLTMLSSSIMAFLTTISTSRKVAITCLTLTFAYLISTFLMLRQLEGTITNDLSFANKCIFNNEYIYNWNNPLISNCTEDNFHICISNEQYLSKYLIDNCDLLILNDNSLCKKFQDNLISKGIINQPVHLCTDFQAFKKEVQMIILTLYINIVSMLIIIPIGTCVLRIIYSIYCIITVGGTGWEYKSAEELLLFPRNRFSNENLIIPYRFSLNGKNFLRV